MNGCNVKNTAASAAIAMLLAALFLLMCTVPAHADDKPALTDAWKEFTDDGFSVSFPADAKKSKVGSITTYDATNAAGTIKYSVAVSPGQFKDKDKDKTVAKTILDGYTTRFGDQVKKMEDFDLNGYPARKLIVEKKTKDSEIVMTIRIYLANNKIYQANASSLKGKQDDAETAKFLDSFKLIDEKPKEEKPKEDK